MENPKIKKNSRSETYQDLESDMIKMHGDVVWGVMDEYIHSEIMHIEPNRSIQGINKFLYPEED